MNKRPNYAVAIGFVGLIAAAVVLELHNKEAGGVWILIVLSMFVGSFTIDDNKE